MMIFHRVGRWCSALVLMLLSVSAMAMTCKTQGSGETVIRSDLSSTVAIPAASPAGSVIWRSERLDIAIICSRDTPSGAAEEVFIYLNPQNLLIGQGIRAGLTLNAVDYVQSSGRISTQQVLPACLTSSAEAACPTVNFNLAFSVFIQKFGPTPPSGVASDVLDYRMFQLDGSSGLDPLPDNHLNYVINNLTGLRFVACDAELRVMPEVVTFGQVPIKNVRVGSVAAFERFALATSRTCDSPFSLNARFTPVTGVLNGDLLTPILNDSIGIRLSNARTGKAVRYHEPFHLTDLLGDNYSATADFNAELVWQRDAPKAGPFEAEVLVDLYYK